MSDEEKNIMQEAVVSAFGEVGKYYESKLADKDIRIKYWEDKAWELEKENICLRIKIRKIGGKISSKLDDVELCSTSEQ